MAVAQLLSTLAER